MQAIPESETVDQDPHGNCNGTEVSSRESNTDGSKRNSNTGKSPKFIFFNEDEAGTNGELPETFNEVNENDPDIMAKGSNTVECYKNNNNNVKPKSKQVVLLNKEEFDIDCHKGGHLDEVNDTATNNSGDDFCVLYIKNGLDDLSTDIVPPVFDEATQTGGKTLSNQSAVYDKRKDVTADVHTNVSDLDKDDGLDEVDGFDEADGFMCRRFSPALNDFDFIRKTTYQVTCSVASCVKSNNTSEGQKKSNKYVKLDNDSSVYNSSEKEDDLKETAVDETDYRRRTKHYERSESSKEKFAEVIREIKYLRLELDEETKWIRNHIKRRECSQFTPAQNNEDVNPDSIMCQCGFPCGEHSDGARRNINKNLNKWNYKQHSTHKMTNAFGEIEFVGYGGNVGKYIRVDVETKMSNMLELMMKVWGMDKPNLLISVTGGAKNFQMNKRLKETFRRGLMKTALTTGAWIITGGTHAGVMKHVGEAVKDFGIASTSQNPVIAIGVAPWGCVQNRDALEDNECVGQWPANYRIEKEQRPKESFLDPNHSHFILVDNGTQHKFATEIPFRASLETEVAKMRTDTGDNAVSVPIVLLVLEGGPGTLQTVYQSIQNNTPAVIVKGSGRAADILAYAYQNGKDDEIEAQDQQGKKQKKTIRYMEDSVQYEVMEMVEKEFGKSDISVHMSRIRECLMKIDLMSVFELDSKAGVKEIDVAMLQALLKANKDQVMDQLRLALAWNRIDVAKSDIFTDDKRWPTGSLDDVMFSAIQLNRVDFVELFLDHGVSLREFLTKKRLLSLYNKIPQNCLLRTLLNKIKNKEDHHRKNFSLLDVGLLMQELMGDYYRPCYMTRSEYVNLDVDFILDGLTMKQAHQGGGYAGLKSVAKFAAKLGTGGKEALSKKPSGNVQTADFENPLQELFIWSVLMIRQDMSKLFWAEGKDAIAAALVANGLLSAMKNKTEDTELAIKIQANMDEWSELAIGVLSECHSTDEHKAQDLLVRELTHWGDATCMLIAVKADNKNFISQTACQALLNSIWMGKMALENNTLKLLLCLMCPPLLLWLIKFQLVKSSFEEDAIKRQEYELDNKAKQEETSSKPGVLRRQTTMNKMPSTTRASHTSLPAAAEENKEDNSPVVVNKMYSVGKKFYLFFNAPVIIFMYNVISYLVFLGLFSYVLLFSFSPNVSTSEIVLMIWVFTIFTEEIRQVATTASSSLGTKLQSYITDTWNVVDIITIGLFIIGMVLRFLPYPTTFEAARVFLALNFVSFFLRLLHIFSVHKELGPKLVMIGRMVQDLMYFVVILMVFVISYAIASHSVLFPNSPLTWNTIISLIRRAYWNIYGELFLEEIEGDPECTFDEALWTNGTHTRCPTDVGKYVVPVMMGVYMLLANVLLLNLLIAMFSYTFQMVQDNTDKHWFYQRYSLIYEYYTRPILCPPFIFFAHIYLLTKFIVMSCCCKKPVSGNGDEDDFRRRFKNERELVQWENVIADAFHHKTELKAFESMEYKVNTTHSRLDMLVNRIDEIQEHQSASPGQQTMTTEVMPLSPSSVVVKMPPQLDERIHSLEKQMEITCKSLEWIMKMMQEGQMASSMVPPPVIPNLEQEKQKEIQKQKKKAKEEKAKLMEMMAQSVEIHNHSRISPYLGTNVHRYPVSDNKVPWNVNFPDYSPNTYTAPEILQRPDFADPDLMLMSPQGRQNTISSFNSVDETYNSNRTSFLGNYEVLYGIPLNPKGRTGIVGRGSLGRWGPNHAGDPIVTRWKMVGDQIQMKHGKPVLEFVAVMRTDNEMWALPGAIAPPGCKPADHLKADFTEEAVGNIGNDKAAKLVKKRLKKLWKKGVMIYEGYADDPRNTDNAWLETTVYCYHDEEESVLRHFNLRAGDTVELATWLTVSSKLTMHGSHLYFLKLAAEYLNAYF